MQIMQYLEVLGTLQERYSGWICSLGGDGGVFAFSIRAMWVVGEKVLLVVVVVVIMA